MLLRRASVLVLAAAAAACSDPAPTTGSLVLAIDGLPAGALASVFVIGPNGFAKAVQATTTLEQLEPGTYTVNVHPASQSTALYAASFVTAPFTIAAGKSETATIHYALASGAIDLSVAGLPTGILPNIRLRGPYGFSRSLLQGGVIGALPAGTYSIRADTITTYDGDRFGTSTFVQNVDIAVSLTPVPVTVNYALTSGTLAVNISGLPNTQTSSVHVTGPGGFDRRTAFSSTYHGLLPGDYTVTASKVYAICPNVYVASQLQQTLSVNIGSVTTGTVSYALTQDDPANLNLTVDAVTLTQATQNYAGTVPLVAGRPALLRVFGVANQCNAAKPVVRLTVGGTTTDLSFADTTVATTPNEAVLVASWNYIVPGALIQPGLTVSAQIDPTNTVAEANESDNTLTKNVDVRSVPATKLRIVPVSITGGGSTNTGDVSATNVNAFMAMARKVHPVSSYTVELRPTFTSATTSQLQSSNTSGWTQVLSEIRAMSEAASTAGDPAYYYGVVKVTYTSGVAGIGYIGAPAAIGWDYLPTGATVLAHELGHNFGRLHTPCGNPGGIDPQYPSSGFYAGGYVGTYGYDPSDSTFKDASTFTDVMGYCNTVWISDYTYLGMMNWLLEHPMIQGSATSAAVQPSILVWGRIENGQPILEPAFEISARPQLPAGGPNRLAALDAGGGELFSIAFSADRIADLPGDQQSFAFVVPKSMLRGRALGALRLTAQGRTTTNLQAGDVGAEPDVSLARVGSQAVRMRWDAAKYPVIMVRDADGNILSFARGGDATIVTTKPQLELNYSNRVRSGRRLRTVR